MLFFISPTVYLSGGGYVFLFLPNMKILTPHNYTSSKKGCNFSQAVQAVV